MRDLTAAIAAFREAARHTWNTAFRERVDWDISDDFDDLCTSLFRALVLRPIGRADAAVALSSERAPSPLSFLHVIPTSEHGVPILINRTVPPSPYWDDPVRTVRRGESDLRFVRFFDWDLLGFRNFEYIEVVVEQFDQRPNLVRRAALIDPRYVQVIFVDSNRNEGH